MNHVLIVGDDSTFRNQAARLIERQRVGLTVRFANNGIEAIEHLIETTPVVVVTELGMPEMDGLQLVREMRARFPTIPVVLMTAHGTEEIAVEALVEGAADYVPKNRLSEDLPRVLANVLGATSGNHHHHEIVQFLRYEQLQYSITHDESLVAPLVDQLQQVATKLGLVQNGDRMRLARCLAEALRNAVTHGYCSAADSATDERQRVDITAEISTTQARFVIRDQGPGFDPDSIADPRVDPRQLTANSGRGLALIRLFMEEVQFNEKGNEITLIKRKRLSSREASHPVKKELAGT